jgi:hypothetical protein
MIDIETLKILTNGGVAIAALYMAYLLFKPIIQWMLTTWTKRMESQDRAHEYQRTEHEQQTDLLKGAHIKLDTIAKVVHR